MPARRIARLVVAAVLLAAATGCGPAAPTAPEPVPSPAPPTEPTAGPVPVPGDGLALAAYGFRHGPARELSLPRTAVLASRVDQPDNVTVVLTAPGPAEVAGYLRRTLPGAGFAVTAEGPEPTTFTFTGFGWDGSVTGTGQVSAIVLRPR